jgi:hypothetical protein
LNSRQNLSERMRKSYIFFLIFFVSIKGFESFAQGGHGYYDDALRFSKLTFGGSARFQSVGGATTALGADIGALSSNPAGLGMYNRSDMNTTAALGTVNTNSSYLGTSQKDHRTFLNIPSSGMIFGGPKDDTVHAWKGGTFGIGLTNVNSFQNQFSYEGDNTKNSMTDFFVEQTNGTKQDSLFYVHENNMQNIPSLAYYSFLAFPYDMSSANTQYRSFIHGDTVHQHETVLTKGKQIQWDIAYGGNINDKLYLGLSIGIVSLKYTANKTFTESTHPGDTLNSYTFVTNRTLKGTGINLRLGMIYKVTEWIRLGATIQTPTYYSIRQTTSYSVDAFFDNLPKPLPGGSPDPEEKKKTIPVITKYNLTTPLRISTGIALFARKQGFVSADIGYLNYGTSKFKENPVYATKDHSTFTADNQSIKNLYHSVFNVNTGAEYRKETLRLRAGLAWYGNPYRNSDVNQSVKNFTLGIGFRFESHYFDMAYVHSTSKSTYQPYVLKDGSAPTVVTKNNSGRVLATFGILF